MRRSLGPSTRRAAAVVLSAGLAVAALSALPPAATAAPAETTQLSGMSVTDVSALLERGTVTSAQLVAAYSARIAAYDDGYAGQPGLHAVIAMNPRAAEVAEERDRERAAGTVRGPLHGVPIVVKDLLDIEGMATTNGAIAFADYRPLGDATVVARLEAAGAVILAKTNLSEFAWSGDDSESGLRGDVRNPYDQSRTSGGSSGGTAAAVAAGFAVAGIGSDTYGSIRTPSAHQSLVGVRPTHGLVSLAGVTPQVAPLDTVGPMTVSVRDAAILLDAIAGQDPADPLSDSAPPAGSTGFVDALSDTALQGTVILNLTAPSFRGGRVGADLVSLRDEVLGVYDQAVEELRDEGATVIDLDLTGDALAALGGRGWYGMAGYLDEYWAHAQATWPAGLAELTAPTDALTVSDYLADGREIESIRRDADWLLTTTPLDPATIEGEDAAEAAALTAWTSLLAAYGATAVVYPTDALPASPLPLSDGYANARNAGWAGGIGAPAVTVPGGYTAAGMPVGIEFMTLPDHDADALALAYDFEQATRHRTSPTSTPALASEAQLLTPTAPSPSPSPTATATSAPPSPSPSVPGTASPASATTVPSLAPSGSSSSAAREGGLASTGAASDPLSLVPVALALLALGAVAVVVRQRRRRTRSL